MSSSSLHMHVDSTLAPKWLNHSVNDMLTVSHLVFVHVKHCSCEVQRHCSLPKFCSVSILPHLTAHSQNCSDMGCFVFDFALSPSILLFLGP